MRTTPAETERNNQIILEAAIEVFAEKGYVVANMQEIAAKAKISRGPLYYRYKTKKELFEAAFMKRMSREVKIYKTILEQEKYILDIFREDLKFCTMHIWEDRYYPEIVIPNLPEMEALQEIEHHEYMKVYEWKIETVKRAIQRGEIREDTDPVHVVNIMYVFAFGLQPVFGQFGFIKSSEELQAAVDDLLYLIQEKYCTK